MFDCTWDYITSASADSFYYEWLNDSTRIRFYWEEDSLDFSMEVFADIHARLGQITFTPELDLSNADSVAVRLVYPIISGITCIDTTSENDRITVLSEYALQRPISSWPVHASQATVRDIISHHIFGYEIINPCEAATIPKASEIPYYFNFPSSFRYWWDRTDSERYSYYYIPDEGGFYIGNHDNYYDDDRWHPKFVRLRRLVDRSSFPGPSWRDILAFEVHHTEPDSTMTAVIRCTNGGYWEEGAEICRDWITGQNWWPSDLATRVALTPPEACAWLLDSTGVSIFAPCASRDISPHMSVIADSLDGNILWIPSIEWPISHTVMRIKETDDDTIYAQVAHGGYKDSIGTYWTPTMFDTLNINVITSSGGHYAPFLFPVAFDGSLPCYYDSLEIGEMWINNNPMDEDSNYIVDPFHEAPFMCFGTKGPTGADSLGWEALNTWRVATLGDYVVDTTQFSGSADGVYFDINCEIPCFETGGRHDHVIGFSNHHDMMQNAKDSLSSVIETYAAMGTENVYEAWYSLYDFYQARAWSYPQSESEYDGRFSTCGNSRGRLIPAYQYLIHEYGPVRMDGWGALSGEDLSTTPKQYGDILYFLLGRTLLWGGLPELNYEWAALEGFGFAADSTDSVTYIGSYFWQPDTIYRSDTSGRCWYDGSLEQLSFVRELTEARRGFCNQFLVYGEMQREPAFSLLGGIADSLTLHGHRYNIPGANPVFTQDSASVPTVLGSAWVDADTIGITLMNFMDTTTVRVQLYLLPAYWGISGSYTFLRELSSGSTDTVSVDRSGYGYVDLPPRRIVLVKGMP